MVPHVALTDDPREICRRRATPHGKTYHPPAATCAEERPTYRSHLPIANMTYIFTGWSSVPVFKADTGGAVLPYGGNFQAVGGFLVFGGNDFGERGKTQIWRYFFGGNAIRR